MTEVMVRVGGGAEVCAETFGDPAAPAVLLLAGAGSSMDGWDPELCRRIAAGGRHVVRYDHRDTGRSTLYPPGEPGYAATALDADAVAVVDAVAGGRAHLVGVPMGGGIAQSIAARDPGRVASLTLVDTSPAGPVGEQLPPVSAELAAYFADPPPDPDWDDLAAVTEWLLDGERAFAGAGRLDEERSRAACRRAAERTPNRMASAGNHFLAAGGDDGPPVRLGELRAPTLVVHGTGDLMFGPAHAEALARGIPGARLLWLEDGGHQVPAPRHWDVFVPAVLDHTAGADGV